MIPIFRPTGNRELDMALQVVSTLLKGLNLDNIKYVEVIGTTSSSANTQKKFKHGANLDPSKVLLVPMEGRIYVPRHGIGDLEVDIRSSASSEEFKAILIY